MKKPAENSAVTSMDRTISRRAAIRTFTTFGVAVAAFLATRHVSAERTPRPHTVTVNTNIRSGPGPGHRVVSVIPKGATFTISPRERNTFQRVTYNGTTGWIYAPLIVDAGSSGSPTVVGEAYTSTAVHLRSGPGLEHTVLRVVARDATLNVSNTIQNGFRYVVHQGLAGWMADQYIAWRTASGAGSTLVTAADLNLRAEPTTSADVLLVLPSGARVAALDGESNGFRKVSFLGVKGWAATAYLH